VFYAGIAAQRLGRRVGVVTSFGPDLGDDRALDSLAVVNKPSVASTAFEIEPGERRSLRLLARATDLDIDDVPKNWRVSPIVHLASVINEVPLSIAARLGSPRVCATPQGWLRTARAGEPVSGQDWRRILALPTKVTVVVSAEDLEAEPVEADVVEARAKELSSHFSLMVLTRGVRGCTVFDRGCPTDVPASAANEFDSTGAGDVFAAGFFIRLAETNDAIESARFASRVAARSVEGSGATKIPTRAQVA